MSVPYNIREVISKKEFWFMLFSLAIVLGVGAVSARYALGWKSAWILSIGMYIILWVFAHLNGDAFIKKILLLGIAAGITELLADCWLVAHIQCLVYTKGEPMIACSPVYMPFSWAVILTQVGYLGWLIGHKVNLTITIIVTAFIGGAVIPLFEHWAKDAGWWYYRSVPMIGNTPYFIAAGEMLLCAALPIAFTSIYESSKTRALLLGIAEGFIIWISYFLFYMVFHRDT